MGQGPATGLLLACLLLLAACGNGGGQSALEPKPEPDPVPELTADPADEPIRIPPGATWDEIERVVRAFPRERTVCFDWPDEPIRVLHGHRVKVPDAEHVYPVAVRLHDTVRGPRLHYDVRNLGRLPPPGCQPDAPPTRGEFVGWDDAAIDALVRRLEAVRLALGGPDEVFWLCVDGDRYGETGNPPSARAVLHVEERLRALSRGIVPLGAHVDRSGFDRPLSVSEEALHWLAAHARPERDGGWGAADALSRCGESTLERPLEGAGVADADVQATALALLAFLGEGYTNRGNHAFAKIMSRGLRSLKRAQGVDGCYGPDDAPGMPLTHASATLAMFEAYDKTGSPIFKGSLKTALRFLPEALDRGRTDPRALGALALIVASFHLHADEREKRGKKIDLELPDGLRDDLREALRTGTGIPAGIELGGRLLISDFVEETLVEAVDADAGDPWTIWLTALGLFRLRDDHPEAWDAWRRAARPRLIQAQRFDGSSCCYRGSWDPDASVRDLGRVGMTALAVRILEVRREIRYHFHVR